MADEAPKVKHHPDTVRRAAFGSLGAQARMQHDEAAAAAAAKDNSQAAGTAD